MKDNNRAQGSMFLYMMLFLLIMFIFISTGIGYILGEYFGLALEPVIGFNGNYPVITLFFAGLIVVFLSSFFTNLFTDWKKMGESQEITKAFQSEMTKARKEGNQNRVKKLMQMQPEIMRRQTESSSGMMKPMMFLIIFIWPIFIWLRSFLADLQYNYFTVPWADGVSFFSKPFLMQSWLWLYLIFSMIVGQMIRQGMKYISWSDWWQNIKGKIRPSSTR